jgi:lysozyme
MRYSKDGMKLTENFEQCRLVAYWDANGKVYTIGWGHTYKVVEGMTCTQEQADAWLLSDVAWAESEVNRVVHVPLTQPEFDGLVDFVFNAGSGNFEKSTTLRLLNNKDYHGAAKVLEMWDMAGGQHLAGLLKRRKAEEALFESGDNT